MAVKGLVHSYESFGAVDGPGVRFVTFMQGCPLRCLYCHNPDAQSLGSLSAKIVTPEDILSQVLSYWPFYKNGGGLTLTGGEPLLQPEFVQALFALCRKHGIHTALDTSGGIFNEITQGAIREASLVLLDIKCIDPDIYSRLTGKSLKPTLQTAQYLKELNKPAWIRYVLVPGWTDDVALIEQLADYISTLPNVEKVEVLPYHDMARFKYEALKRAFPLPGIKPPSKESVQRCREIFRSRGIRVS